ncbi:MAG: hypothetical protein QOD47_1416 [Gemmatimonadaceae bacterium]|jgi:hypothetical protein|nr:hypothetical protein [Gemmatimonadaceae bacterium]
MAETMQTYETHGRYIPVYHFFAVPVLLVNVVVMAIEFVRDPRFLTGWAVIVAVALFLGMLYLRFMPLRAQDRVIRLEERTRLERLLPSELRGRISELSPSQLIAIRFAPDDEVPELTRRALSGDLKTQKDIKRAIRNWRADHLRV